MSPFVALLRAVNVGGRSMNMSALRMVCEDLGLSEVRTLLQSGNVLFKTPGRDGDRLAAALAKAIEEKFAFSCDVIVRTPTELHRALRRNPFACGEGINPSRVAIVFMAGAPPPDAQEKLEAIGRLRGDRVKLTGRELHIHFRDGAGSSKLTPAVMKRVLKTPATARNINTVEKLVAIARQPDVR